MTARILANHFTNLWGRQVLVLNLPGGGGTIAARAAATAAPDGYTMFMPAASIFVSMPELYPDTSINPSRDLVPVGFVGEQPLAIAVSPSLGVNSLKDLIALSQKQPEKINWAAITPVGTLPHLTGELFRSRSGANITSVPYPSTSEAVNDILSGRVQMIVETLPSLMGLVAGGKLKVLAFASEKRLPDFPDVPTVSETLPGFVAMGWFALVVPAGTDPAIMSKQSRDLGRILARADLQKQFLDLATYTRPMSPGEASEFIRNQQQMWKPVLTQVVAKSRQ